MTRGKERLSHNALNYLISIVLILIVASVLIPIQGSNPIEVFYEMVNGMLGSTFATASSIRWSTPVIISSMAAMVVRKSGISNLGIEGQIYFRALTSVIVGAYVQGSGHVVIPPTILAGAAADLLYAVALAVLKMYWNIDEMITTLMFNYVATQVTEYLIMMIMGLSSDINPGMIATSEIQESARLTRIVPPHQASTGILIGLGIAVVIFILYKYTRVGYEWKMIGRNRIFVKYGGIRYLKNYFIIFLCSGVIVGVCGAVETLGLHLRFRMNFSSNMGWGGIVVALVVKNNPAAAVMVAVVQGMIEVGSMSMERITSVNRILVTLVQVLFVLFITVDFRTTFQKVLKKWNAKEG